MINILAPINQLGYGIAGLNIVKNLSSSALWPIGQVQVTNEADATLIRKAISHTIMPDFNAPCIRIWHQHDMSQFVGKGCHIGFPFFELDEFSTIEKHHLNSLDKLFVTSKWAKIIAENELSINADDIYIVPLGVDENIFYPQQVPNKQTTVFFNCGKWEIRKGHDVLVKMFNEAFNIEDDVELWMMCENPFLDENESAKWKNLYLNSKLGSKIRLIPRALTQIEVYNIMLQTDCGIFPSRAEGWNLELLEMMACGKPVIATNYSAHTEFCTPQNSYLIDIDSVEDAYDGKWFHGQYGHWAHMGKNQIDQAINYMQIIHKNKQENTANLNQDGIKTAAVFSWNNTTQRILNYV
jgi:glycosyltransferase involved in cell wall biosynthesis